VSYYWNLGEKLWLLGVHLLAVVIIVSVLTVA
jgi:hypothetical protein